MRIHILLDGDWILYTAGFAAQKTEYCWLPEDGTSGFWVETGKTALAEAIAPRKIDDGALYSRIVVDPLDHALHTAKQMIASQVERVLEKFGADAYTLTIFLDGEGNFRESIATIRPYKGNRAGKDKPILYNEIRQYLEDNYETNVSAGCESDDELAIVQTLRRESREKSIIVGIDKDLLQVPGYHLNPNKGFKRVGDAEALGRLYRQAITGDTVDNIAGAYKCGGVYARKAITPGLTEEEMWDAVVDAYAQSILKYPDEELYGGLTAEEAALENMRLVYLKRYPDEPLWLPPQER